MKKLISHLIKCNDLFFILNDQLLLNCNYVIG